MYALDISPLVIEFASTAAFQTNPEHCPSSISGEKTVTEVYAKQFLAITRNSTCGGTSIIMNHYE